MKNDDRNRLIHRNFGPQSDDANKGLFVLKSLCSTPKMGEVNLFTSFRYNTFFYSIIPLHKCKKEDVVFYTHWGERSKVPWRRESCLEALERVLQVFCRRNESKHCCHVYGQLFSRPWLLLPRKCFLLRSIGYKEKCWMGRKLLLSLSFPNMRS